MGADEAGTRARFNAHLHELIEPAIASRQGRIVKTTGDALLIEFASVVDAVQCAVEIQRGMAERNGDEPDERRMDFRIGVNLGDVIIEGDDIHGDGVNVAARLEALADPGAVVVSGTVHEHVRGKLDFGFDDLGPQEVKNIVEPVHAYSVGMAKAATSIDEPKTPEPLTLPDKPSIAVLAFENMSGDPEQEYLADGITEDIITALSKFRWFFVTARNSTFTYKGSAIDIKQVGQELGVRYVLEGSVRKAANRIRITAQLIEAASGNHIWAERYDRELDDIFELQDEITLTIAAAVEPELAGSERHHALHKPTDNLQAWDLFHRGTAKIWKIDQKSMTEGAALMRQALAMDPNLGQAYAYLAFVNFYEIILSRTDDRDGTLQQGIANARRAIAIDRRDYTAHWALGRLHSMEGKHQSAIREMETSIDINPNFAHGYFGLATSYIHAGEPSKAIDYLDMAIRLSPNDPLLWGFFANKGIAYGILQDFDSGIEYLEEACRIPTTAFVPFTMLAALYALAGRLSDAEKSLDQARRLEPSVSMKHMREYWGTADQESFEIYFEGFRKAGLTE